MSAFPESFAALLLEAPVGVALLAKLEGRRQEADRGELTVILGRS